MFDLGFDLGKTRLPAKFLLCAAGVCNEPRRIATPTRYDVMRNVATRHAAGSGDDIQHGESVTATEIEGARACAVEQPAQR